MKNTPSTYKVRLPHSIDADGIGINQFVATAVAETLSAMNTAAFYAERRAKADFAAMDRIMGRAGGTAPATEDTAD